MAKNASSRSRRAHVAGKGSVVLVIDCINDLEFDGGEKVLPWARRLASRLVPFLSKARKAQLPVIYVNDNFGHWHSSFHEVYDHCTRKRSRGREVSRRLKPKRSDYFILKPRHSGFFATSLVPLLEFLGAKHLILCGIATNLCVLFTAHDAHMHAYPMTVLSDCCAAESDFDRNTALKQLERFCGAGVCLSSELKLKRQTKSRRRASSSGRSQKV
jgi:nicotinamidase-related amidase